MKPPDWMMRSKALRSTTRSLITGNALERQGSTWSTSPSLKWRMWSWQTVVPRMRPVRLAVDHEAARAADPLAAVVLEGDRLLAALGELLVEDVQHLEEGGVLVDVLDLVLGPCAPRPRGLSGARRGG